MSYYLDCQPPPGGSPSISLLASACIISLISAFSKSMGGGYAVAHDSLQNDREKVGEKRKNI